MILLETTNKIISETLLMRLDSLDKPESLDVHLADYDGVLYHLHTPNTEDRNQLRLSMNIKCFKSELLNFGAMDVLKREYGQWLQSQPLEQGFDVTLDFDFTKIPENERVGFITKVASLKTNAMTAPFERAFDQMLSGEAAKSQLPFMAIHYRDEESIYIRASQDRVTVIFSVLFRDETDKVFAKVFLQEFVDCRKQPALQNAPQALYTNRDPPLELRDVPGVKTADNMGYVTFVLFPRHFQQLAQRQSTIALIQYFRDYLHYHIKCSKAYMHSRMRSKVDSWLKVLNRAKPESDEKNKKTASGKTFVRK